ncbi:MAG: hypothetical protein ACI4DX_09410 [Oliverpabstia sp.]
MSDMTIGDSWGIENYMPDMDDDKGTSIILVHSSNGEKMFESIRESIIVKEAKLDEVLPPIVDSRKSVETHPNRIKYLEGLKRGESFDVLYGYVQKNLIQKVVSMLKCILIRLNLKS